MRVGIICQSGVSSIFSNTLIVILILSTVVSVIMLYIAIFVRRAPKSLYFSYMILSVVFFNVGYLFELSGGGYEPALLAAKIEYLGIPFIIPFLLLFVWEYCTKTTVKIKHLLILMTLPVISSVLVLTWPWSNLFYKELVYKTDGLLPRFIVTGGIVYYVYFVYSLVLVFFSIGIVLYYRRRGDSLFKKMTTSVVIATMLPAISYVINILKLGNLEIDVTPIFLSITCILLVHAVFRQGLYMLAPIAQEQIVENMNDGFILTDTQGVFIDANSAAKKLFPELCTMASGSDLPFLDELTWHDTDNDKTKEFAVTGEAGLECYYQVSQNLIETNGKPIGWSVVIHDITESKKRLDEVTKIAEHDALTGLLNRGTLYKNGKAIFAQFGSKSSAAVLMMDIDFFKRINDSYGHLNGDEVLKGVADSLVSNLRATDLVGRYGGEEFCVFLPRINDKDTMELAEKLRAGVENIDFILNDEKANVTISIGIAVYDDSRHKSFELFLADADTALYDAKNMGRNRVKRFCID